MACIATTGTSPPGDACASSPPYVVMTSLHSVADHFESKCATPDFTPCTMRSTKALEHARRQLNLQAVLVRRRAEPIDMSTLLDVHRHEHLRT